MRNMRFIIIILPKTHVKRGEGKAHSAAVPITNAIARYQDVNVL
jgi:hypothetical protein